MAYEPRFFEELAFLNKVETNYGADAGPLPADRIIMSNVTFRPLVAQRLTRDLMLPYMGNQGVILAGIYATIEGDIEMAGSGVAGTPPLWGSLARISGMQEVIDVGVKVTYQRGRRPHSSSSAYFVMDKERHVLLGCRANLVPSFSAVALPRARVSITGLLGTLTTLANQPVVNTAGWITPVPVNKQNTRGTIHGWDIVGQALSFDLGNRVTPRFLIGDEAVLISGQSATGNITIDAPSIDDINFFDRAKRRLRGAVTFEHGTEAGNIIEINAPAVEVGEPAPGNSDGVLTYQMGLDYCVTNGFDDLTIVVR